MESLTEHRRVSGPVVYGFLRLLRVSAARQGALMASLAEYCRSHELLLSGVFTERSAATGSAAFTGLLDVLALPDTYGVVAPAASHLGTKPIAGERQKRIETAGARLLLVRGLRGPRPSGHGPTSPPSAGRRRGSLGPAPALDAET
ncbi:hypothetical protein SAMN06272775_2617 [Streptomyces sp. 2323.1]|uniref:hypothetical protein n=1 Tax=Streptomyces sp. 2323.1 TaxID=1938841 RepID=UPI000BC00E56|nr:hypothetical protein [Streptomyces sp. 2323.1]SOE11626.1 hypothetical protein SAMN06272775_2617 [Streptomyces sp. 2323.1]